MSVASTISMTSALSSLTFKLTVRHAMHLLLASSRAHDSKTKVVINASLWNLKNERLTSPIITTEFYTMRQTDLTELVVNPGAKCRETRVFSFLQPGHIACNAERCISHGNSVRPSVRPSVCHTLVPYLEEWRYRIMRSSLWGSKTL